MAITLRKIRVGSKVLVQETGAARPATVQKVSTNLGGVTIVRVWFGNPFGWTTVAACNVRPATVARRSA